MNAKPPSAAPLIGSKGTLKLDKLLTDAKLMIIDDGNTSKFSFLIYQSRHLHFDEFSTDKKENLDLNVVQPCKV